MVEQVKLDLVETWLTTALPGGKWIFPHWQDGPFWLVPVTGSSDAHWQAHVLLDAHEPLVAHLPLHDGYTLVTADVYAVSQFTCDTLTWHQAEDGLHLLDEVVIGPFEQRPTITDLMDTLPRLMALGLGDDTAGLTAALESLRRIGNPDKVLPALAAMDIDAFQYENADGLVDLLNTVAAVLTDAR